MTDKKTTYRKEIIEIADIIFANPDKKMSEIMRDFSKKCGKSPKTIERWISASKEYNKNRLKEQEKIKDEAFAEQTKNAVKKGVLSRIEALEILTKIAKGNPREIPVKSILKNGEKKYVGWQLQYPSDSERTKAIQQLSKINGWEAPTNINAVVEEKDRLNKNEIIDIITQLRNEYKGCNRK
ncbi:MAG: hypothetical protein LBL18_03370 [Bacteroidales bacterium]|jgi:hypothetical protein|nr:hypothetical protein [Bacteroidales bacterium]